MQKMSFVWGISVLLFYIPLIHPARGELSYDEWQKTRVKRVSVYASVPRLHLLSIMDRLSDGTYCKSLTSFEECIHLLKCLMGSENITDGSQLLERILILHHDVLNGQRDRFHLS